MVNIAGIAFSYGRKKKLFEGLDLQLAPGNIYGLLGKNGAGKTTLLKIIAGVNFAQQGRCVVLGYDACRRDVRMYQDLYYLPEAFHVPAYNGKTFLQLHSPLYPRFSQERFAEYAREWEIDLSARLPRMSQGEQKKFMIAFALATRCRLLLLDEPTNGLDIPSKAVFRKIVAGSLDEEQAFVISTHQVRDLEGMIDPLVILDEGRIVLNAALEEIEKRLYFDTAQSAPEKAFAVAPVAGGTVYVRPRVQQDDYGGKTDLELLFSAVVNNRAAIARVFGREG